MWQRVEISHKVKIEEYTKGRFKSCDYIFSNLLLWSIGDELEFLEEDNILYLRGSYLKKETYFLPLPKNRDNIEYEKGIEKLLDEGKEIELIPEELYPLLSEKYTLDETRDSFDYIYKSSDLRDLLGRKYTKKRNKVNQFIKNYDFKIEEFSEINMLKIKDFQREWFNKRKCTSDEVKILELEKESKGLEILLDNYSYLGIDAYAIMVAGKIVAYTMGEKNSQDTITILVEKASDEYKGGYQAINSIYLKNTKLESEFINREDDAGEEGLRRAKESYYPVKMLKKYKISKRLTL